MQSTYIALKACNSWHLHLLLKIIICEIWVICVFWFQLVGRLVQARVGATDNQAADLSEAAFYSSDLLFVGTRPTFSSFTAAIRRKIKSNTNSNKKYLSIIASFICK